MTKGSNLPTAGYVPTGGPGVDERDDRGPPAQAEARGEYALIRPGRRTRLSLSRGTAGGDGPWAGSAGGSGRQNLVDGQTSGAPSIISPGKGMGAALGRQPKRIRPHRGGHEARVAGAFPVTAKIRLGWNDADRNYMEQAPGAVTAAPTPSSCTAGRAMPGVNRGFGNRPTGMRIGSGGRRAGAGRGQRGNILFPAPHPRSPKPDRECAGW